LQPVQRSTLARREEKFNSPTLCPELNKDQQESKFFVSNLKTARFKSSRSSKSKSGTRFLRERASIQMLTIRTLMKPTKSLRPNWRVMRKARMLW